MTESNEGADSCVTKEDAAVVRQDPEPLTLALASIVKHFETLLTKCVCY